MSEKYLPLYRKYRPKNLQEVVGQEHVKKALTNAIKLNKISHAYLFTGPRGTGKTSVARILAKSLNCKEGPTITPCEVCPSCIDITNSNPMDVIEIDAASNRKVEDARDILEKIQYVPVNGKYKIYIIDEVHMLTKEAFNTLLKTLEEPPENVIFILATTEPQKVLETITSRCQRFDFRRITTDDIIDHLKKVAKAESIKIDNDALFTIAKNSAGGMRDSLALLDQVSVLDNAKTITSDDVNKLLGRLSFDMLNNLSENIIQSKPQDAIELLEKIYNSGNEPLQILTNLLGYLKNLLIVKNCQTESLLVDLTQLNDSQIKILKKQSENIDTHQIIFLVEKVIYYIKELKTTTNQHLWLEIAVIDLANLAQNTSLLQLQERIQKLEAGIVNTESSPVVNVSKPQFVPLKKEISAVQKPKPKEEKPAVADVIMEPEVSKISSEEVGIKNEETQQTVNLDTETKSSGQAFSGTSWQEFLEFFQKKNAPACAMVKQHANPVEFSQEKIVLVCKNDFYNKTLNSEGRKKIILEVVKEFFKVSSIDILIRMATVDDEEKLKSTVEKKNTVVKTSIAAPTSTKTEESEDNEEISEEDEFIEHELSKKNKKEVMPSDQVTMVMNLFDGKYIDS